VRVGEGELQRFGKVDDRATRIKHGELIQENRKKSQGVNKYLADR